MNNCVKCGNPLQPGVTSCPICGTVAQPNNETLTDPVGEGAITPPPAANIEEQTQPTASVETPTEPAPAAEPAPAPAPAAPAPAPAEPAPAPAPTIDQNGFASSQPAAPAPAPAPAPTPAQAVDFSQQTQPAAPTPAQAVDFGAQNQNNTFQSTPSVGDINPMNPGAPMNPQPAPAPAPAPTPAPTTKKDPKTLIPFVLVAVVAVLVGGVGGFFLNSGAGEEQTMMPQVEAESLVARSNGFSFDIEKDWIYNQYGDKVIINNKDESLTMRIGKSSGDFNNISLTNIENSLMAKEGYSDISASKTKLDEVDIIYVECKNEDLLIQYYYLQNDETSVITAVVIYETEAAKASGEEYVKNIVKSLKYTDEAVKAIGAINMYSSKFDDATYAFFDALAPEETLPATPPIL